MAFGSFRIASNSSLSCPSFRDDSPFVDASLPSTAAPWRSGLRGARANLWPGLTLQLSALALVVAYYNEPGVHGLLTRLVGFRQSAGLAYGMASTALFAGVLPFLYIRIECGIAGRKPQYSWNQGLILTAFWTYKGLEIDLWYRLLAHALGTGHSAGIIALKAFFDQFAYCPAFAIPTVTAAYEAVRDRNGFLADIRTAGWYRRRVLPILISNWAVWVPTVMIIYSLPTPLQLPLQNIVIWFYTLIVAHQTRAGPLPASQEAAKAAL
jgi:hypothetical protein